MWSATLKGDVLLNACQTACGVEVLPEDERAIQKKQWVRR
jgi:hypothetical protein